MDGPEQIRQLSARIEALERENERLRRNSSLASSHHEETPIDDDGFRSSTSRIFSRGCRQNLSNEEIERYSRQLLLSNGFGVSGQQKLLDASVCVIGAGGIGSTVIPYLAACGVGKLTIIDFDTIEVSNLHRQVIHKTKNVGMNKAQSAVVMAKELNPTIVCEAIEQSVTSENALSIISKHDCVVDASDNPQTRYVVNDACVLAKTPLISGSAIGTEGQLTVHNYRSGPCYRCLYPKPDKREGSKSCSDNGVLGPVPGIIGVLQAVETLKVLTGIGEVIANHLLMYDSLQCSFLRIKKPPRPPTCPVCGKDPRIKSMADSARASEFARGPGCSIVRPPLDALQDIQQITVEAYATTRDAEEPHVLLDVRVPEQYELCSLPGATNVSLKDLDERLREVETLSHGEKPIYCICRRGIASVAAAKFLTEKMSEYPGIKAVVNIRGGLDEWRRKIDTTFPKY